MSHKLKRVGCKIIKLANKTFLRSKDFISVAKKSVAQHVPSGPLIFTVF